MGRVNLENDVKFLIHGPFELGHYFYTIIEDNVLITYMKFHNNYNATLVPMATVQKSDDISY